MSPDGRWICFQAHNDKKHTSQLGVVRADRDHASTWTFLTGDDEWYDKPRWSTDGRTIYYVARHDGVLNVWGMDFDSTRGVAVGEPFQVTHFDGVTQILPNVVLLELGISDHQLAIPMIQPAGGIWMLENVR